ncbi:hypothetical protein OpiT1DRAFT_01841 [Opitutaceae bacterium TAV1]|nr:hypothetical protein OpiT1DRAFT_01841 [Opitutaceae bacterium TAV1]
MNMVDFLQQDAVREKPAKASAIKAERACAWAEVQIRGDVRGEKNLDSPLHP